MITYLKDLVDIVDWKDLRDIKRFSHIRNKGESLEGYRVILEKLKLLEPFSSNHRLILIDKTIEYEDDDGKKIIENWISVNSSDGTLNKDVEGYEKRPPNEEAIFLAGGSWQEWLAMEIDQETLRNFNYGEIVGECIWEMTFFGFFNNAEEKHFRRETPLIFISHASEDKKDLVRPLVIELQSLGITVWYDEFEIKIGDSIRQKIKNALSTSQFGIIVLSKHFIGKGWTEYELNGLLTKEIANGKTIFPIWHNVTFQEVLDYDPSLADKYALNTNQFTAKEIAHKIQEALFEVKLQMEIENED